MRTKMDVIIFSVLALVSGFTASYTDAVELEETSCSDGWVKLHRGCYQFVVSEVKSWEEAAQYCETAKGQLTSIQSTKEQSALQSYLGSQFPRIKRWWVGFLRKETRGTNWIWLADSAPVNENIMAWRVRAMSRRPGKVCGELEYNNGRRTLKLSNNHCRKQQPFICEFHSIDDRPQINPTQEASLETTPAVVLASSIPITSAAPEQTEPQDRSPLEEIRSSGSTYGAPSEDSALTDANAVRQGLQVATQCSGFGSSPEDVDLYRRYLRSELTANEAKVRYYVEVSRLYKDALESQKRYYATSQKKLDLELNQLEQRGEPKCNISK